MGRRSTPRERPVGRFTVQAAELGGERPTMLREFLRRLLAPLTGGSRESDGGNGSDDGSDDEGGFAGSLLDASVRWAHGGTDGRAVERLQEANERAAELEDAHRENR